MRRTLVLQRDGFLLPSERIVMTTAGNAGSKRLSSSCLTSPVVMSEENTRMQAYTIGVVEHRRLASLVDTGRQIQCCIDLQVFFWQFLDSKFHGEEGELYAVE